MTADYRGGPTLYASPSVEIETAATSSATPVGAPRVSIVIPVLDEERTVEPLYDGIVEAVDGAGLAAEVIFVDDGSTDGTFDILSRLHDRDDVLARRVEHLRGGGGRCCTCRHRREQREGGQPAEARPGRRGRSAYVEGRHTA